ncbi:hypothetical protein N566_25950 [Streptomycetaceae bacterium MP113-05]|nr:hypothetical protein N566_25950 [Streptomycetaceae bacterium MP113-05]
MNMGSEFYISSDALESLSKDFDTEADKLGEELAKFKPKTDSEAIHDGFGFLTESDEVTSAYIDLANHTTQAVEGLQRHLNDIADGIKDNSSNTKKADEELEDLFNGEGK